MLWIEDYSTAWWNYTADLLAKSYATLCNITTTTIQIKDVREEQKEVGSYATPQYSMTNSITIREPENALNLQKQEKYPWQDGK